MRQWIRSHLTYANVTTTILLFLVLGGGSAYALTGSNTVFSDDITNNQVYSADVRDDTLSGGGLTAADLRTGSVGKSEVGNKAVGLDELSAGYVSPVAIMVWDEPGSLTLGATRNVAVADAWTTNRAAVGSGNTVQIKKGDCSSSALISTIALSDTASGAINRATNIAGANASINKGQAIAVCPSTPSGDNVTTNVLVIPK